MSFVDQDRELRISDVFRNYSILAVLGRGLKGDSYHVMDHNVGKEFILKTLEIHEELSLQWTDLWQAEQTVLGQLAHVGIDRILSSGKLGTVCFSLKDFIHDDSEAAQDLDAFRKAHGGRLSPFQGFHFIKQVVEALKYASEYRDLQHEGIFHGNLKPSNFLIINNKTLTPFEVKITDFEPYALFNPATLLSFYKHCKVTTVSHERDQAVQRNLKLLYSPYDRYPPEWKCGENKPNCSSDIFALGVITYQVLFGHLPQGRFPWPSQSGIAFNNAPAWDNFIKRCLAHSPDDRYGSYDAVLKDVHTLAPEEGSISQFTPSKTKRRRTLTPVGMIYIPAGVFFVGSEECGKDSTPKHECSTPGFYMDRTLVTVGQFRQFVEETAYVTEAEQQGGAPLFINGEWKTCVEISWKNPLGRALPNDFHMHPVTQLTYKDAEEYANWLERRLPTEEEWEYAARGGLKDVKYPYGNQISKAQANYGSDGTTPVMAYQPNAYGLYDMAGNVWEWTNSWYKAYPGNKEVVPHFGENYKVVRGGAWQFDATQCMISFRNANDPQYCYPTIGLRTVCDYKP